MISSSPLNNENTNQNVGDYNPYNIKYHEISIDEWNSIPCQNTEYSFNWSSPEAFSSDQISQHIQFERKYFDNGARIFFFIHCFILLSFFTFTLILAIRNQSANTKKPSSNIISSNSPISIKNDNNVENNSIQNQSTFTSISYSDNIEWENFKKIFNISFFIALSLNFLIFIMIQFAPAFYIKSSFLGYLIINLLFTFNSKWVIFLVTDIIFLILALFWLWYSKKFLTISICVLKNAAKLLIAYPFLFIILLIEMFSIFILYGIHLSIIICCQILDWTPFIYIFCLFSISFTTLTISYIGYLTFSGLGSSWYFLKGTPEEPFYPVYDSFRRAITTSLGSAALAGIILAFLTVTEYIINIMEKSIKENRSNEKNEEKEGQIILRLFMLIILCILKVLLSVLKDTFVWMTRYGLIYCATFGLPFKEGCQRWLELQCTRFSGVIIEGCIITNCTAFHEIILTFFAGFLGYLTGDLTGLLLSSSMMIVFFTILQKPFQTLCDTIFICFAEYPERMDFLNPMLCSVLKDEYNSNLRMKCKSDFKEPV